MKTQGLHTIWVPFYLYLCKVSRKKLTLKNLSASFNCFSTPLRRPSPAIRSQHKQLVAALLSPSSDVWTRFQTSDLPHTVYPTFTQGFTSPFRKDSKNHQSQNYFIFPPSSLHINLSPLRIQEEPSLPLPFPLGAALSNSSTQACPHLPSVTVYLWCSSCLRLHSYQHRHIRALNFTAILAHHTSSSLSHPDKWQHSPQSF